MNHPQYLYKYFLENSIDCMIDNINEKYVYFNEPSTFNDVFDCACSISREELLSFPVQENTWENIISFLNENDIDCSKLTKPLKATKIEDYVVFLYSKYDKNIIDSTIEKISANCKMKLQ